MGPSCHPPSTSNQEDRACTLRALEVHSFWTNYPVDTPRKEARRFRTWNGRFRVGKCSRQPCHPKGILFQAGRGSMLSIPQLAYSSPESIRRVRLFLHTPHISPSESESEPMFPRDRKILSGIIQIHAQSYWPTRNRIPRCTAAHRKTMPSQFCSSQHHPSSTSLHHTGTAATLCRFGTGPM